MIPETSGSILSQAEMTEKRYLEALSLGFQELLQLEYSTRHIPEDPEVLLSSLESVVQHVNSKP